jgi:hypothetical protein
LILLPLLKISVTQLLKIRIEVSLVQVKSALIACWDLAILRERNRRRLINRKIASLDRRCGEWPS